MRRSREELDQSVCKSWRPESAKESSSKASFLALVIGLLWAECADWEEPHHKIWTLLCGLCINMPAESNGTTLQSSTACKLCEVSTSGCLRYTVRIPPFNAVTIMTLLCNGLVWKYLALRHWTGVFCNTQSFIIIIPHLLPRTKMDDSVTPKKMKHLQQPLVVEWSKRSPSAPYHFRLHLSLCRSSKSSPNTFMDIIIVLSAFATHQEPPANIGFVFIQSDWINQLYRRVWGTLLPSVDGDTNQE